MFDWVLNPRLKYVKTYTFMKPFTAYPQTVVRRCSVKKVFLVIAENSQENTCVRVSSLIKLQVCNFIKKGTLEACNFIKKRLRHRCFPVNFAQFLRTPFFTENLRWLFLPFCHCKPILIYDYVITVFINLLLTLIFYVQDLFLRFAKQVSLATYFDANYNLKLVSAIYFFHQIIAFQKL